MGCMGCGMTNAETLAAGIARRHDLDALRAFAMLLGIVLHGALAFIPGAWVVTDVSVEGDGTLFAWLTMAIHGFRMPLFFLMSGFFTAMLWRQRGLRALVRQRAQRLLLPLAIAMFTVIPLTAAAWTYAASASTVDEDGGPEAEVEIAAKDNVWAAAALGDIVAMERHASAGAPLDAYDPTFGVTPLSWAVLHGRTQAAEWLLDNGGDVGTRNRDGSTALHSAAFMGRPEIARLLLDRGADANAVDANGARPLDSSRADAETTAWVAELLGLSFDETALEEGRREAAQLLDGAAKRTDAAGGVAPYRDGGDAGVKQASGLLAPWYWGVLYADEWGALFTQDVFSPPLVPLVPRLAGGGIRPGRVGCGTTGLASAATAGAAGGDAGALPVGRAGDDGSAVLHGRRGPVSRIRDGHPHGAPPRAACAGELRCLLRVRRRLLGARNEGGVAHRAMVATDAAARADRVPSRASC